MYSRFDLDCSDTNVSIVVLLKVINTITITVWTNKTLLYWKGSLGVWIEYNRVTQSFLDDKDVV